MIHTNTDEFLWVEKYRPKTIDDCILPKEMKETFKAVAEKGELHNMLLSGPAGCGKTTVARALCADLDLDSYLINGSENGNIDTLRTDIRSFASTVSLMSDKPKVVILDEADYLNAQSTQPALRGFMEEFSKNCRFILTCNYRNKLIKPLHSRCSVVEFKIPKKEQPALAAEMMKRCQTILKENGVKSNDKVVVQLIMRHFPDFRRVLNELQRYSASGEIDEGILANLTDTKIDALVGYLKAREFNKMRKWVVDNLDTDTEVIFHSLYNTLYEKLKSESYPAAVLVLADYSYKSAFVADQEINLVACLTELMLESEWK